MGDFLDTLARQAGTSSDGWVEIVVNSIQGQASKIQQPEFRQAVVDAVLTLSAHKEDIKDLGIYGLTLFLQKLATGDTENAYVLWLKTQATFQDLIDGEKTDAFSIIESKKQRDLMVTKIESLVVELTLDGAKILIPFILALL